MLILCLVGLRIRMKIQFINLFFQGEDENQNLIWVLNFDCWI